MANIDVTISKQFILLLPIKIQDHLLNRDKFYAGIGKRLETDVFTSVQKMCPGWVLQFDV